MPARGALGNRQAPAPRNLGRVYNLEQPDRAAGIGSAGQLARVSLKNFMNHENFKIDLKYDPAATTAD